MKVTSSEWFSEVTICVHQIGLVEIKRPLIFGGGKVSGCTYFNSPRINFQELGNRIK